jgi:hypothetical protein
MLVLCAAPSLVRAEPFRLTEGLFDIGRPLIGTQRGVATMIWLNPPASIFGPGAPDVIDQSWQPFETYSSTLPGTNEPVLPVAPGPMPVAGVFAADGLSLQFSAGPVSVPREFPPTDSEDLYTLTTPFSMTGHWTFDLSTASGTVRFDRDIVAGGLVRVVLGADRTTGNSLISAVIYDFQDTEPVPEPTTILLVGLGTAGIAARVRRSLSRAT